VVIPAVDSNIAAVVAGPFVASCALLVIAGCRKVAQPRPAALAVAAAGVRVPRAAVIAFGAIEVGAGVAGAIFGAAAALAVALCYLVLGGFALRLLRRAPATPCACLGSSTATVSRLHLLVNLGALAAALVAASGGSPVARLAHRPLASVVLVVLVACCVQLAALALDALPVLEQAVKETAA
jgi:hypothetical protein